MMQRNGDSVHGKMKEINSRNQVVSPKVKNGLNGNNHHLARSQHEKDRPVVENDTAEEQKTQMTRIIAGVFTIDTTKSCLGYPMESLNENVKDRFHFVLITMFMFGISSLLPWNFFITANDYWMFKFRNVSAGIQYDAQNKTELQATFTSYLAIASKVPFVLFLLVNAVISHRIKPLYSILIPLIVSLLLFILTTVFTKVNTDSGQRQFLILTLTSVIVINVVGAFFQGGTMSVAACLPHKYMTANVKGQAIGGVIASVAQIATLALNSSSTTSALAYFLIAVVTWILTLICFVITHNTRFYNIHLSTQIGSRLHNESHELSPRSPILALHVFKQIWPFAISCLTVFWVTLAVFPAITVLTVSQHYPDGSQWTDKYFIPVTCFLLFNVGDLLGRLVANWLQIASKHRYLVLFLCLLRIIFIPLFMLCNATNATPRSHFPVYFHNDAWFIIFMCIFSVTNGYLCTVVLTAAPKDVEMQYQSIAGAIMAATLGGGLMLGSVSSYGLLKLL